jgi:FemAB-related protein (PEP-CTERM system-associated)
MPVDAPVTIHAADWSRDAVAIDTYVRAHPDATPFHLSAWSLGVAEGCDQRAHCLIARDGDVIRGILPLTEVHSPLFGRALVSNGFAVSGGILADDARAARALASEAWALAGRLSCPTLELRGGSTPGEGWRHDVSTYLGFSRDLAKDAAAELLAIPRKQRAEVRRSLESDLTVDLGDRDAHYRVYAESVHNLGTPVFPRALFENILDRFGDAADILTIRHHGDAVASVLSLYFRGTVYPYWGGGTATARALRANDRMYYALMLHARARGCTRFDFGRSKAGTGPAAFKKNWGFEGAPLSYSTRIATGAQPRSINPLDPKNLAKVELWKRLPLSVANRLGPLIARGLG